MSGRREFVMLAHVYKPQSYTIKGWFCSEKMDGIRVLWDGGISRGLYKSQVPWANNAKDERFIVAPKATGLWTRYGNVMHAPDWFLDQLPDFPLDGEFFTERGSWQQLSSIIKKIVPNDDAWTKVTYNVFDIPPYASLFQTGLVNNPNYVKQFELDELLTWARERIKTWPGFLDFAHVTEELAQLYGNGQNEVIRNVIQTPLESVTDLDEIFRNVIDVGGEGIIVRNPKSYWEPRRSHQQVKIKPNNDAEGTVTGYVWGRKTDKGSKLLGLMGALILDFYGKQFELSGFTDSERVMTLKEGGNPQEGYTWPGLRVSSGWTSNEFPIGTRICFKYRELSDEGIPKEARYFRKRDSE